MIIVNAMSRSFRLRQFFEPHWSQRDMARFVNISQPGIFRVEKCGAGGASDRVFDLLEAGIARGVVTPDMTPQEALAAFGVDKEASS